MTAHVSFKKTDIVHMLATVPSPIPAKHLFFGEQGLGGRVLEFFLNNIIYCDDHLQTGSLPDDVFDRINEIAKGVPAGSGGILFLPWLNGLIVPEENPHARGAFYNLSLNTTRGHLARSLMEGIAYNNRWTFRPAEKFIGQKLDKLRFAGGGALSDVWSQILADVLGVPIHQVDEPTHTAARGCALFAFYKLGYRTLEELPDLVKIKKVYEPNEANRPVYDKMYSQFIELYRGSKKVFTGLNG
jgi:xylulokinase